MKVIHIIPSMNSGGAETMLFKLVSNSKDKEIEYEIITFKKPGFYTEELKEKNLKVTQVTLKDIFNILKKMKRADIIQSWMYHSDSFNFIVGKVLFRKKIIFNIRRSYIGKDMKPFTYFLLKLNGYFSKYVDKVVSCSITGKKEHIKYGYCKDNFEIIFNGFELDKFNFVNKKIDREKIKLINIARWDALKDHRTLLNACSIVKESGYNISVSMIGKNIDINNLELLKMVEEFNLIENVDLLGERKNISEYLGENDIYVSSSISEGFPNVIGEAMATGLICVATDAGDTKYIVNNSDIIVPIKDPRRLANKIIEMIEKTDEDIQNVRMNLRQEIEQKYSINNIIEQYENLYKSIYKDN